MYGSASYLLNGAPAMRFIPFIFVLLSFTANFPGMFVVASADAASATISAHEVNLSKNDQAIFRAALKEASLKV